MNIFRKKKTSKTNKTNKFTHCYNCKVSTSNNNFYCDDCEKIKPQYSVGTYENDILRNFKNEDLSDLRYYIWYESIEKEGIAEYVILRDKFIKLMAKKEANRIKALKCQIDNLKKRVLK